MKMWVGAEDIRCLPNAHLTLSGLFYGKRGRNPTATRPRPFVEVPSWQTSLKPTREGTAWARPAGRPGQPQSGEPGICRVRGWVLQTDSSAWGPQQLQRGSQVHLCMSLKTGTADAATASGLKDPMGFVVSPRS